MAGVYGGGGVMRIETEVPVGQVIDQIRFYLDAAESYHAEMNRLTFKRWHNDVVEYLAEHFTYDDAENYFVEQADLKGSSVLWTDMSDEDRIASFNVPKARKALRKILKSIEIGKSEKDDPTAEINADDDTSVLSRKVFVVHGHDRAILREITSTLEKLEFVPVVINELANQGNTIIEKIEQHSNVGFAVVAFTPDDKGASKSDFANGISEDRPRQNVILELGYFWGRLKRNRVCLLNAVGEKLSSDLQGLGYTKIDGAGLWRFEMAKELKAAGYEVDLNNLM
ncbi:MAG: nucleotide-binding protein [Pseudomonadota bacterium]